MAGDKALYFGVRLLCSPSIISAIFSFFGGVMNDHLKCAFFLYHFALEVIWDRHHSSEDFVQTGLLREGLSVSKGYIGAEHGIGQDLVRYLKEHVVGNSMNTTWIIN